MARRPDGRALPRRGPVLCPVPRSAPPRTQAQPCRVPPQGASRERTMMKPVSVAIAALLLSGAGLVGPAHAETFEDALIAAYQTNPTLQARRALLRAVDEQVPQALSNWRPQVSIQGSAFYRVRDTDPGEKGAATVPATLGVVLDQNIFRGFRTLAQTDQAEAAVQAERATLMSVEQTVLLNAARAYVDVVRDQAVVELNRNNEEVLRRQLEAAQDRFRVGEITRTDVAQAESRLAGAIADRIEAENTLETSRANYEQVIGHPPVNLVSPAPFANLPRTLDDAVALGKSKNPDIVSAEYAWHQARAVIRDEKGKLLPTLTGEVSYTWTHEQSVNDMETTTFQAGVNLSIPLYQSGAIYSQIRDAKHRAGQRRLQVDEQRDQVIENLTSAWQSLQSARARVDSYESQIEAATIALEGVQREAQVGSRTTLDVLDAEQELLTSRVNLVRAQRDLAIYTYELLAAMGSMTAADLALETPVYDPTEHYRDVRNQWFGGSTWADRDAAIGDGMPTSADTADAGHGMGTAPSGAAGGGSGVRYVVAPGSSTGTPPTTAE